MLNFTMKDSRNKWLLFIVVDHPRLRVPSARISRRRVSAPTVANASSRTVLMSYGLTWNTIDRTRPRDATPSRRKGTAATAIGATSNTREAASRISRKSGATYTRIIEIPFSAFSEARDRS